MCCRLVVETSFLVSHTVVDQIQMLVVSLCITYNSVACKHIIRQVQSLVASFLLPSVARNHDDFSP